VHQPQRAASTVSSQQGSAVPRQRDYWLTTGWRTAPPKAEGMDPAVLATITGNVSSVYPQIRSVLVVRHGYLVYGHTACPGHGGAGGADAARVGLCWGGRFLQFVGGIGRSHTATRVGLLGLIGTPGPPSCLAC
jgi:hypothetical protein